MYYWNDVKKLEFDFVIEKGDKLLPIEVKTGETLTKDQLKGLIYYRDLAADKVERSIIIYAGIENYIRDNIQIVSWQNL